MRDWKLVIAPVAAIIYFTIFQDQFVAMIVWAERFVR